MFEQFGLKQHLVDLIAMPLSTKIACDPAAFERSETEFAKFVAVELRAGKVSLYKYFSVLTMSI